MRWPGPEYKIFIGVYNKLDSYGIEHTFDDVIAERSRS